MLRIIHRFGDYSGYYTNPIVQATIDLHREMPISTCIKEIPFHGPCVNCFFNVKLDASYYNHIWLCENCNNCINCGKVYTGCKCPPKADYLIGDSKK
jgi:hypothetical protein